jgi:purine-binding chemotaxis protein CheW
MSSISLFVFVVDSLRMGLPLQSVVKAVPACELTPLPEAPMLVVGAFNLHGQAIAVLDLRRRLGLLERPIGLDDYLLIIDVHRRRIALLIDEPEGVLECPADALVPGTALAEGAPRTPGLIALNDGLLLVEEPAQFLDTSDMARLDRALAAGAGHGR